MPPLQVSPPAPHGRGPLPSPPLSASVATASLFLPRRPIDLTHSLAQSQRPRINGATFGEFVARDGSVAALHLQPPPGHRRHRFLTCLPPRAARQPPPSRLLPKLRETPPLKVLLLRTLRRRLLGVVVPLLRRSRRPLPPRTAGERSLRRVVLKLCHSLQQAMHDEIRLSLGAKEEGGRAPQDLLPHEGYCLFGTRPFHREVQEPKKVEGHHKTYYHTKDIAFLAHDPFIERFRYLASLWSLLARATSTGERASSDHASPVSGPSDPG